MGRTNEECIETFPYPYKIIRLLLLFLLLFIVRTVNITRSLFRISASCTRSRNTVPLKLHYQKIGSDTFVRA